MTLGGLALAVGILVDMSTVEVENIHTHLASTPSVARAALLSNGETAVPRLLALVCVLAVFLPSLFMEGAARELFVPLSMAVGFAMAAAYLLSSTFVPVLSVWMLRPDHVGEPRGGAVLILSLSVRLREDPGSAHALAMGRRDRVPRRLRRLWSRWSEASWEWKSFPR